MSPRPSGALTVIEAWPAGRIPVFSEAPSPPFGICHHFRHSLRVLLATETGAPLTELVFAAHSGVVISAVSEKASADDGTPWWLTLVVGFIALAGTIFSAVSAQQTTRKSANLDRLNNRLEAMELDKWRHREETMRMLRWASEKAIDPVDNVRLVGIAALGALGESELLQREDQALIDRVIDAILQGAVAEYHEAGGPGDVEVVEDGSE
jgi:hypothetical protein